jgi:hypothetical protein
MSDQPFTGVIVGSHESNALRLLLQLASCRMAIRNAQTKDAYLHAATAEWDIHQQIDVFAHHVQQQEQEETSR